MIIIDAKEPKSVLKVFDMCEIPYEIQPLSVGDFTNDKGTFIAERKSFLDFWNSMIDRRIYEQTARMYQEYQANRYVFVEVGSLCDLADEKEDKINWLYSIFGMIENWECNFREYLDIEDLARKLDALDKQLGKERKIREEKVRLYNMTTAEKMLAQVPSVGEDRSKDILKVCDTFLNTTAYIYNSPEKLLLIHGIGVKIIDNIKKVLEESHEKDL